MDFETGGSFRGPAAKWDLIASAVVAGNDAGYYLRNLFMDRGDLICIPGQNKLLLPNYDATERELSDASNEDLEEREVWVYPVSSLDRAVPCWLHDRGQ